jgi:hypothetical protein
MMPSIKNVLILNLFGWFFLTINKNTVFFEELFLALTFAAFFLGILQAFNNFFFSYYVDRINNIKSNYRKIFLRRKEAISQLIESYTLYRELPAVVADYSSLIYIRFNEMLDLEIAAEEKIIEESFKRTLQGLYKL